MNENSEREREREREKAEIEREKQMEERVEIHGSKVNLFSCFVSFFSLSLSLSLSRFRRFCLNSVEVKERFRATMRDWRIKMDDDRITVSKLPRKASK